MDRVRRLQRLATLQERMEALARRRGEHGRTQLRALAQQAEELLTISAPDDALHMLVRAGAARQAERLAQAAAPLTRMSEQATSDERRHARLARAAGRRLAQALHEAHHRAERHALESWCATIGRQPDASGPQ